jgi:hypothetical protein
MFGAHPMLRTGGAASYSVPYSLRFRYSNNASLSRTGVASPTNDKVFTWSGWVKLGLAVTNSTDYGVLFNGYTANSDAGYGVITISNPIAGFPALRVGGWATNYRITTAAFRDPSAWYHIVLAIDTTNATAGDRIKIYVNGTQITSFGTSNNPSLNATMGMNNASTAQRLGLDAPAASANHFDGYMAEVNFIDGQALTPSSFGQTDSATGVWVPKAYAGTYGTNGFYLKFADASAATATAIGKDSSGNGNNWTPSGISVTSGVTFDQMLDTPTLNYAVLNAVDLSSGSLSAANMQWALNAGSARRGTFGMKSGKWYFECAITSGTNPEYFVPGIQLLSGATTGYGGTTQIPSGYGYLGLNGNKLTGTTSSAYGSAFTTNDVISVAFDADAGKIWFAKNGTWQASGDPAAGTNAAFSSITSGDYFPYVSNQTTANNNHAGYVNFGQRAFSYTPPTGFKALNTANLPTPSIKKGSLYMDATLRTGTGATASVSSLGFQPNLVWIKSRSAATNHNLFDSTRGVQKGLGSNLQSAQYTDANSFTAFNSNGYSLGSDASSRGVNINTNTYVDWAWKEGVTPGFDVVTFAGTGSAQAVNHGLGVAPEFMIMRVYDDTLTRVWACWHKNLTSAAYYLALESSAAQTLETTVFNSTAPTSTQFTAGSYNSVSTKNSVAYLWASVEGFSKFGSYTGNGSTDGPFVWCGFRPRYVLIKSTGAENWSVQDSARNPYNVVDARLKPNSADAEGVGSAQNVDFLSNGFKLRTTDPEKNSGSVTYIFAAFAENPFKYARAR